MSKFSKFSRTELSHHLAQHKHVLDLARRLAATIDEDPATKSLKRVKEAVPKLVERLERDLYKLEAVVERADRKSSKRSDPRKAGANKEKDGKRQAAAATKDEH